MTARDLGVRSPTKAYRPDIDGLRAIAVLSVLFFHAGLEPFSGGFVGVDVFFVISGFLITGIIAGEIDRGDFSIAKFYERRIRRIFPALYFTIAITLVGALALFATVDLQRFYESLGWLAIFASNIYFMNNSGYFDAATEQNAILQTWSLAIEEQFYVFFPLFLVLIHRQRRVSLKWILLAVALASFAYSVFIVDRDARTAFFSAPGRAWELMLGALLALEMFPKQAGTQIRAAVASLGAALVAASVVLLTVDTPFPGLYALPACAGAAAVIWSGTEGVTPVSRILATRPMVFVGLISYSLYLLHWPLLTFTRYWNKGELTLSQALLALAFAFALAIASWRYVETPFRRSWPHIGPRALFASAICLMAVLCAGGFGAAVLPSHVLNAADMLTESERQRMIAEPCMLRDTQTLNDWPAAKCRGEGDGGAIAVWGDSFAAHYFGAFRILAARTGRPLILLAESSCPPIAGLKVPNRAGCEPFNRGAIALLTSERPAIVVLSADWIVYEKKKTIAEAFTDKFALLKATIAQLRQAGIHVVVIGPSPGFAAPVPQIAAGTAATKAKASYSRKFDRFFADLRAAGFIDYFPAYRVFCDDSLFCTYRDESGLLFWDPGHLTERGGALVLRDLVKAVPALESGALDYRRKK